MLDNLPDVTGEYVLEVSSPGVERPLTTEKHFRRAHSRLVALTLTDGSSLTGRIAAVGGGLLHLVVRGRKPADLSLRELALHDIAEAVVQVEFSPPSPRELELAGQAGTNAGDPRTEAGA